MVFQSEINECGLACLAMISNFYCKQLDIRELRNLTGLNSVGTSAKELLVAAEQLDMQGRVLKMGLQEMDQLTLPAILHWDLDCTPSAPMEQI
jgi:ATP-binding cassette subfamily B protein RaxB